MLSNHDIATLWSEEEYKSNPYPFSPNSNFKCKKGHLVRSKAELYIANWLYDHAIPYRYESELFLPGDRHSIYPDFTIMAETPYNAGKLEPIYLEYFGMMSNNEYCVDALNKINRYAKSGIIMGINLIAFFEADGSPMNTTTIDVTLRKLL